MESCPKAKIVAPSPKSMIARGSKISLCKLNTQNGTRTRLKSGRVSSTGLNPKLLIAEEAALGSFDDRITASSFGDLLKQCCKTCHFPTASRISRTEQRIRTCGCLTLDWGKVSMARLIQFYIPSNFRPPKAKWIPPTER